MIYGCSQPRELWFIDFNHVHVHVCTCLIKYMPTGTLKSNQREYYSVTFIQFIGNMHVHVTRKPSY